MKVCSLLLVLFFGTLAWTQTVNNKPDSSQPVLKLDVFGSSATPNLLLAKSASPYSSFMPHPIALAPAVRMPVPKEREVVERTVDKKFLILFGMAAVLTVTDIELSQHCLQAGTCHEANPLYGTNPTRARMYGMNIPILGAQTILSAWLKRRHPERNQWMISPIAESAFHGIGSITGATK